MLTFWKHIQLTRHGFCGWSLGQGSGRWASQQRPEPTPFVHGKPHKWLWVSRQHLHCACSTHGTLSQHQKGKGGGGKKVYAVESASKSRLINSENRRVLVGDLQQRAWWAACASAHKGSKKHPLRAFPGSVRQWAMHPLGTSCSAWPMFVMLNIHLWFPRVGFYTCGQKHEQLNIQLPENSCSRETGESREDILSSQLPSKADFGGL